MKALVLAAGKGERLHSIPIGLPKPMIRIGGKPILEWVIDHLRAFDIRDIIINLHYLPSVIKEYFGDGGKWGVTIGYSFEPELLGTAGAVRKISDKLGKTFIVYYGDNLCSCDLERLQEFHRERGGLGTIVIAESYDEIPGGVIELDSHGRLTAFSEKPASLRAGARWENGGIYVLEDEVIDYIPKGRSSDFGREIFPAILDNGGELYCYKAEGYVRGIDTPERFRMVQQELEEGKLGSR